MGNNSLETDIKRLEQKLDQVLVLMRIIAPKKPDIIRRAEEIFGIEINTPHDVQ